MTYTHALRDLLDKVEAGNLKSVDLIFLEAVQHSHAWRAFNGSLDAAKALHEAVLPGWAVKLWACDNDMPDAKVYPPIAVPVGYIGRVEEVDIFSAETENNLARAWLIAILRAMIAQATP